MRLLAGLAFAGMMGLGSSGALAGVLPDGGVTVDEVAKVLQSKGYRAEISKDSAGDPMIISGLDGSTFRILFYNCKSGRCAAIQFATAFDLEKGLTYSKINGWNREKRFGRAYLDDDMDPFLEMDVDLEHGAMTETIANNVDTWAAVLPAFKNFLDE